MKQSAEEAGIDLNMDLPSAVKDFVSQFTRILRWMVMENLLKRRKFCKLVMSFVYDEIRK